MDVRSRIVGHGDEAPEQLLANPLNFRRHPGHQMDALRGSMRELGWVKTVLVNKRTGYVLDGHARVEEAIRQKLTSIPVTYIDLSPEEERLALAVLDPITEIAIRDQDALASLLADVTTEDKDLQSFLATLGQEPEATILPGTDLDDAPEPPADPVTKPGDLIIMGRHRLLCGDSTRAESWDAVAMPGNVAVFTSPPYGAGNVAKLRDHYVPGAEQRQSFYGAHKDDPSEWLDLMNGWCSLAVEHASCVVCNVQMLADNKRQMLEWAHQFRGRLVDVLVWDKVNGAPQMQRNVLTNVFEWCFVFSREDDASRSLPLASFHGTVGNIVRIDPRSEKNEVSEIHRAIMPSALVSWFLENIIPSADAVIDPFGGSGTTMIACEAAGKASALIEMDPRYCDVIVARWEKATGQTAVRLETHKEP